MNMSIIIMKLNYFTGLQKPLTEFIVTLSCCVQVQDLAEEGPWTLFVETLSPESNAHALTEFDKDCKLHWGKIALN